MLLARSGVPPVTAMMASFGTGESAIGSLNVAVIVVAPPDLAALGEYVRAAVGAVLSTVIVAPLGAAVGAVLSTSSLLVSGAVKLRMLAVFPNASWIVLPFKLIAGATAMPSVSVSPLTMV